MTLSRCRGKTCHGGEKLCSFQNIASVAEWTRQERSLALKGKVTAEMSNDVHVLEKGDTWLFPALQMRTIA